MTDKTSTAPVMSREDAIVRNLCCLMNSLGLAWAKDPEARTDDSAEAAQNLVNYVLGLTASTPDVVGGDVVALPNKPKDEYSFVTSFRESCDEWRLEMIRTLDEISPNWRDVGGPATVKGLAAPRVQGEIIAWVTPEGDRSITAAQKAGMVADGGAGETSVRPFSVPAYAGGSRVQGDAEMVLQHYESALADIHAYSHNQSSGPEVPDDLWEIREMSKRALETVPSLAAQPRGDVLDAPALVGNTIFDRGTKYSNVIARAQLAYKHKDDVMPPEQVAEMRAALDRARGTQAPIAASHPAEQTRGDGVAAIPSSFLISKKALEGIHYMCGGDEDGAEIDDRWCEGMAWIGHLENGDGTSTYGLHLHNADYPEEGSITIAQFVERDAPRQAVPDGWQPIKTAPTDGVLHARGLHVKTNRGWYFDVVAGYVDESGQFADLNGDITRWSTDDYEYWHPLTAAPSAWRMGVE